MAGRIPLSRPCFDRQEAEAVDRVLASGWVVQGPEVEAFEGELAKLHSAKHCVVVSSGTAALHVAYLAIGLLPGDIVFVPSFAWPSAAHMAKLMGAEVVFVDIEPRNYNLDVQHLESCLAECRRSGRGRPRVIVPVHEFGLAANLSEIQKIAAKNQVVVIEDAACALGATYQGKPVGTFGALGTFSFHPRKSITTGEGGAIVTNDSELAAHCREWRNHGQRITPTGRDFCSPGLNYRMTEIQAAIGRVQIRKFPEILEGRRHLAREYCQLLSSFSSLSLPFAPPEHTWQTFMTVLTDEVVRSDVVKGLVQESIEAGPGSVAGHLGKHFQPHPKLPISEKLHYQGLALPLYGGMTNEMVHRVVESLSRILKAPHVG